MPATSPPLSPIDSSLPRFDRVHCLRSLTLIKKRILRTWECTMPVSLPELHRRSLPQPSSSHPLSRSCERKVQLWERKIHSQCQRRSYSTRVHFADLLVFKDQISPFEAQGRGADSTTKAHRHAAWVRTLYDWIVQHMPYLTMLGQSLHRNILFGKRLADTGFFSGSYCSISFWKHIFIFSFFLYRP